VIICGGGAKPTDLHLASIVHCIDDEIIGWLKRRERRVELRDRLLGFFHIPDQTVYAFFF